MASELQKLKNPGPFGPGSWAVEHRRLHVKTSFMQVKGYKNTINPPVFPFYSRFPPNEALSGQPIGAASKRHHQPATTVIDPISRLSVASCRAGAIVFAMRSRIGRTVATGRESAEIAGGIWVLPPHGFSSREGVFVCRFQRCTCPSRALSRRAGHVVQGQSSSAPTGNQGAIRIPGRHSTRNTQTQFRTCALTSHDCAQHD